MVMLMFPVAGVLYAVIEPMNHDDFVVHGRSQALLPVLFEIMTHIESGGGVFRLFFSDMLRCAPRLRITPEDGGAADKFRDLRVRKRELISKLSKEGLDIMVSSTFLAFSTFTGSAAWQPSTWRGKAFTSMWTLWCVVVVAAYTVSSQYWNTGAPPLPYTCTRTRTHTNTNTNIFKTPTCSRRLHNSTKPAPV